MRNQTIVCLPDSVAVDTLGADARGAASELRLGAIAG
ncbi:UNVERIFIED_ORG: hypothetical protein ABIC54_003171 [Burkholderia sp. 1263]|jgi:two-component system, chemotaxis family, sensor kinase CheA|uniref:Uncharacterized protein n=1 Tax=Paraburkholderia terricola TaxID=169427 RepID=A0ABU1LW52_9BURK|nr:hypothetical protein [Paraburkholderia terricola]MDR6483335.1 hypothetical protein [Paraburkholderia terricola]